MEIYSKLASVDQINHFIYCELRKRRKYVQNSYAVAVYYNLIYAGFVRGGRGAIKSSQESIDWLARHTSSERGSTLQHALGHS